MVSIDKYKENLIGNRIRTIYLCLSLNQHLSDTFNRVLHFPQIFKYGFEGQKIIQFKNHELDLVTDYDKKIENLYIQNLKEKFPDHE